MPSDAPLNVSMNIFVQICILQFVHEYFFTIKKRTYVKFLVGIRKISSFLIDSPVRCSKISKVEAKSRSICIHYVGVWFTIYKQEVLHI